MKKLQYRTVLTYTTLALVAIFSIITAPITNAASDLSITSGADAARGNQQVTDLFGVGGVFTTVSNILLFIIGALSVIMIIIGGLRYVISGGNSTAVTSAKNTILYAVVGLIVALLAFAIINFVLGSLLTGSTSGGGTNV